MAQFEDKVLHELDGIKEYDNPMPGWLMAIWWGSLIFAAAYLIFYALSFGEGSMEAEYRADTEQALTAVQAHYDANPLVPPTAAELLAGAGNAAVVELGATRFAKSCASCHGAQAQERVDHAVHHPVVAGDDGGGDHHGVAVAYGEVLVGAVGHAGEGRHRLSLGARADDHELFILDPFRLVHLDDQVVAVFQVAEGARDLGRDAGPDDRPRVGRVDPRRGRRSRG